MNTTKASRIEIAFSPEDYTDICAVNDHHLGKLVKDHMKRQYKQDLQENRLKWVRLFILYLRYVHGSLYLFNRTMVPLLQVIEGFNFLLGLRKLGRTRESTKSQLLSHSLLVVSLEPSTVTTTINFK